MAKRERQRRNLNGDGPRADPPRMMGATEDEAQRGEAVVAPEVTDMGRDERGRDQLDGAEFGRGEMPDQPAVDGVAETGDEDAGPRYGRSPRQGLGGARPHEANQRTGERDAADISAADMSAADTSAADGRPERRLTPSGTLPTEEVAGQGTGGAFGERGDGGGGMLNTEVPAGMAGTGPLGGSPARGDTADAAAERRKHGMAGPSAAGARGIHLGIGHNSPTGESTPGMHAAPEMEEGTSASGMPARADTPATERERQRLDTPGREGEEAAPSLEAEQENPARPRAHLSDLPTGSGAGGARPHLDPRLDGLPEGGRKDG